eukprot:TRINITY_DN3836_c0_g1_i1.p1 TRINITY_DN3836_c0_g1~~TRINITY_DN3836_c0_g1_i1.p1  ORF type:complete len:678 (-),score=150.23 TRINITY_DN3836_c0_g1_i1:6-2039(-)
MMDGWKNYVFMIVLLYSVYFIHQIEGESNQYKQIVPLVWSGSTWPTCQEQTTCPPGTYKTKGYLTNSDPGWNGGKQSFHNALAPESRIARVDIVIFGVLDCALLDDSNNTNLITFSLAQLEIITITLNATRECTINTDFCPFCTQIYKVTYNGTVPQYHSEEGATNTFQIFTTGYSAFVSISNATLTLYSEFDPSSSSAFFGKPTPRDWIILGVTIGSMFCCVIFFLIVSIRFWHISKQREREQAILRRNLEESAYNYNYNNNNNSVNEDHEEKKRLLELFGWNNSFLDHNNNNNDSNSTEGHDSFENNSNYENGSGDNNKKGSGDSKSRNNNGINVQFGIPNSLNASDGMGGMAASPSNDTFIWGINKQINPSQVQIGRRIGRGSYGDVFLGRWHGTNVAVKKLPAQILNTHSSLSDEEKEEWFADFQREATIMRSLRHPNILQLLATYLDPPDLCIIMEYMERGSLYNVIHDKTFSLSWKIMRSILMDAARGMAYLHNSEPPVIHRDLKSHNLLVDKNWKCKVCDFGLAKMKVATGANSNTMTSCGTPAWTAPEVLRNEKYTEKCDVYSFGILVWECVTGRKPHENMPPFQVVFAVGTQGLRPVVPSFVPRELRALIVDCWGEDGDARPTFVQVLERLEKDMSDVDGELMFPIRAEKSVEELDENGRNLKRTGRY